MCRYLVALCFVALFTTSAQAERPFNWTGFYVGAHGGYAGSSIDPAGDYPLTGAPTQKVEGGIVGLQVGAQYQWHGGLVTGVEADISGTVDMALHPRSFGVWLRPSRHPADPSVP